MVTTSFKASTWQVVSDIGYLPGSEFQFEFLPLYEKYVIMMHISTKCRYLTFPLLYDLYVIIWLKYRHSKVTGNVGVHVVF